MHLTRYAKPMTIASAILYCCSYRKATEIVFENSYFSAKALVILTSHLQF